MTGMAGLAGQGSLGYVRQFHVCGGWGQLLKWRWHWGWSGGLGSLCHLTCPGGSGRRDPCGGKSRRDQL